MICLESPFPSRWNIGHALSFAGLTGMAVELGTHRGDFAKRLLDTWPGVLHCVDPWFTPEGYEGQAALLPSLGGGINRDEDMERAAWILRRFIAAQRCYLHRKLSHEAVKDFADGSLHFVYIDADHRQHKVLADLNMWWPKIAIGGFIGGHDILTPDEPNGWQIEVRPAVEEFIEQNKILAPVFLIPETGLQPWSFMVQKVPPCQ